MRKIAFVTGGSLGIGRSIVKALSKEYHVYFTYRSHKDEAISIESQFIQGIQVDSRNYSDIQTVINEIISKKPISVLVNNAGITKDKTCRKMTKDNWDDVIEVNLNSAFYYTQACLDAMIESGWGRIINISSVIGVTGGFGQTNYAAAKAGLIGFTKSLALELASKNITVNAIAPGFIYTEMTKKIPSKIKNNITEKIPMGRFGKCDEISSFVQFLASEKSSYITGQVIHINGGFA
ncbi:MAG: beta-ketoacyl-ACP reductase [Spirochaetia bacterium]|nr:beta-ketoacyl-ACP reductase [Spirochaetia bacterium]